MRSILYRIIGNMILLLEKIDKIMLGGLLSVLFSFFFLHEHGIENTRNKKKTKAKHNKKAGLLCVYLPLARAFTVGLGVRVPDVSVNHIVLFAKAEKEEENSLLPALIHFFFLPRPPPHQFRGPEFFSQSSSSWRGYIF